MAKRSFSDLTPRQQRLVAIGGVVQVSLQLFVLIDLRRRSDDQVRGSKRLWRTASFVNTVGPLAYLLAGRR